MEPRPKISWEGGCCRVNCYLFSWTYSKQIACSLANINFYESWLASSSWDHEKAFLLFPLIPAPLCGPIAWKYLQISICYLNLSLNALVHQQVQNITLPKSFWDAQQLLSSLHYALFPSWLVFFRYKHCRLRRLLGSWQKL